MTTIVTVTLTDFRGLKTGIAAGKRAGALKHDAQREHCARLLRIRAAIRRGRYSVASQDVAESLLHHMFAR